MHRNEHGKSSSTAPRVITVPSHSGRPAPCTATAIVTQNRNSQHAFFPAASITVASPPISSGMHHHNHSAHPSANAPAVIVTQNGTHSHQHAHSMFAAHQPVSSHGTTHGQPSSAPVLRHP
jgi:hypothetical protein